MKKKMDLSVVGKNIRYFRNQKQMSQEKLAEKAHLSANYVGQIELGNKTPSLESLITIAKSLQVSVDLLLSSDLIDDSHYVTVSILNDKISHLSDEKQKFIYAIVDKLVYEIEKDN